VSGRLDPQARALLERSSGPAFDSLSVPEARRAYREGRLALAPPPSAVEEARDLAFPGAAGEVRARCYRPLGEEPGRVLPGVVYFHGGGWTCGDLDTHDSVCRGIAVHGRCSVVAVDYRMGPEHKFPAAVEDALAAVKWVAENARLWRSTPRGWQWRRERGRQPRRGGRDCAARVGPGDRDAGARLPGRSTRRPIPSRSRASRTATGSRASCCAGTRSSTSATSATAPTGVRRRCAPGITRACRPRTCSPPV